MVVEIEHMAGIGFRQPAMAADDHHVLVIVVRGAEAEIVRAGDHRAVVAEGVDHHDLVVNDGKAVLCQLRFPCSERVVLGDGAGRHRTRNRAWPTANLAPFFLGFPGSPTTVTLASDPAA